MAYQSNVLYKTHIPPQAISDNTTLFGFILDTKGATHVEFLILLGLLTDANATFTVQVDHSDNSDMSGNVPAPDNALIGTEAEASFNFTADNQLRRIKYKCVKRYVRIRIIPANNEASALIACAAGLSGYTYLPKTQTSS